MLRAALSSLLVSFISPEGCASHDLSQNFLCSAWAKILAAYLFTSHLSLDLLPCSIHSLLLPHLVQNMGATQEGYTLNLPNISNKLDKSLWLSDLLLLCYIVSQLRCKGLEKCTPVQFVGEHSLSGSHSRVFRKH